MKAIALAFLVLLGQLSTSAVAQNLITNGSFESPVVPPTGYTEFPVGDSALSGWTVFGPSGMNVAIVGDISHSRVARSNIWGLKKLGAKVWVVGPPTLAPSSFEKLGVNVCHNLDDILPEIDCFNMLRIQLERQDTGLFPSLREYSRLFGLNGKRMKRVKRDCLVLHPGPINRGVELTPDVADGPQSVILNQVTNGLAIRMAVLYLISGAAKSGTAQAI